ncbi:MAG: acyltransferase family protein [bacterium]|nr:acyltransferase family protein [bacterium]MCM1375307.1 acyltransferase family protein [Muribaculum sp.]MCM1409776.1 acyltransferase family protein [Lachnospiraceae bacterium]
MQKNRMRYLDIYKGIGIVLVLLGHIGTTPYYLGLWLNAFHMPLFFVAAGLLIGENKLYNRDAMSIVRGRLRAVMLPYMWFSLIAIVWDGVKAFLTPAQHFKLDMIGKLWDSLSLFGVSVLWFLPAFFVGATGYQLLRKKAAFSLALPVLTALTVALLFLDGTVERLAATEMSAKIFLLKLLCVIPRGCLGAFFCAVGEGMGILVRCLERKKWSLLLTGLVATLVGSYCAVSNVLVSVRYLVFGNMALFLGAAVCLTGGILLLCRFVEHLPPLEYLGKYSLIIMVTHLDLRVFNIALKVGGKVLEWTGLALAYDIVVAVVIIVLELFWIWLLDGRLSFLLGRKGRKNTGEKRK